MLVTHSITQFNLSDELFHFTLTKCKLDDIQEIKINFVLECCVSRISSLSTSDCLYDYLGEGSGASPIPFLNDSRC